MPLKKWNNKLFKNISSIASKEGVPKKKLDTLNNIQQYIVCHELSIFSKILILVYSNDQELQTAQHCYINLWAYLLDNVSYV